MFYLIMIYMIGFKPRVAWPELKFFYVIYIFT